MIGNVLTIKQLEALVWVAQLGSFRKAAHHLSTTQPNISARISTLEKTLGVVLMQRDSSAVHLTEQGREILDIAHRVLRNAESIVEVANRPDLVIDRLRLGVTELVACTWLHSYLRQIKAMYPALNVELTVDLSRNLDVEFQSNQLDLTIQSAPFASVASGLIELGKSPYVWVASPLIADQLPGRRNVADLLPFSILTHARHTQACSELTEYTQKNGLSSSRIVASNSLASCVQMAKDAMGVSLLPLPLVAQDIEHGHLVKVDVNWVPAPLKFAARYQKETAARHLLRCAELAPECAKVFT